VLKQFSHLRETYLSVVTRPMDFGTMRTRVFQDEYATLSQLRDDAALVLANAQLFNRNDTYVLQSAAKVFEAFMTVATVAAPRLPLHLRGPFFEREPEEEPQERQQAAVVHCGGLLSGGASSLGIGPHAVQRPPAECLAAHFKARYRATDEAATLTEVQHMCHAAAWAADDAVFAVVMPDGASFEFQTLLEGCYRRPLQRTFPSMTDTLQSSLDDPIDLATMVRRIQDARYPTLSAARAELVRMGQQAREALGEAHLLAAAFRSAIEAACAAWDAEADFLAPRLSPPPPAEQLQAAQAAQEEALRASQKATAKLKAADMPSAEEVQRPQGLPTQVTASRPSLKRSVDGTPVSTPAARKSSFVPTDPSAAAAAVVKSVAAANRLDQQQPGHNTESDLVASLQSAVPLSEAIKRQAASREFAVFQNACNMLRDPRFVRAVCNTLFVVAKGSIKSGASLRENADVAVLLALLPSGAAQYAPLLDNSSHGAELLGAAAGKDAAACASVVPPQTWAGVTMSTAAILQVMLNKATLGGGPPAVSLPADSALAATAPVQLYLSSSPLQCPVEEHVAAVLRGAASGEVGWQVALRGTLPWLGSQPPVAICLLRVLSWAITHPGSALVLPHLTCTLAASVAHTLRQFCPKAQAKVAGMHKVTAGMVHCGLYSEPFTQHIFWVIQSWLPALISWAGSQALACGTASVRAQSQAQGRGFVPSDADRLHSTLVGSSSETWSSTVLPLLLAAWHDVAKAAAAAHMLSPPQRGHFLHLFLQLGGKAAFFHTKDCTLPPPVFALDRCVLPPGSVCCSNTLLQSKAFRCFQYQVKSWLKDTSLGGLAETYDVSRAEIAAVPVLKQAGAIAAPSLALLSPVPTDQPRHPSKPATSASTAFDAVAGPEVQPVPSSSQTPSSGSDSGEESDDSDIQLRDESADHPAEGDIGGELGANAPPGAQGEKQVTPPGAQGEKQVTPPGAQGEKQVTPLGRPDSPPKGQQSPLPPAHGDSHSKRHLPTILIAPPSAPSTPPGAPPSASAAGEPTTPTGTPPPNDSDSEGEIRE
jgi:hypothetical protein